MRWLLVQVAISMMRLSSPDTTHLRVWAKRIADRRGKKTAVVALARKLASILLAMMRDKAAFTSPLPKQEAQAA